ncbi:ABC transporter permease [Amycolatopsis pithecellobii]|uniref:ABC transporter permease n=1 Tax=Amycolatopsis pithecellobii TaxID=664692 RepID=A0A6N7ZBH2_9PSEU|nr:ABC transporter permease [Amycolatopsis pithecellobii]MTD59112.1 ABC transporter permease [Amycolatopsis pithecellobii]
MSVLPAVRRSVAGYLRPVVLLVATIVVMSVAVHSFSGESAVFAVLEQVAMLGLLALGVSVTMVAGELDLSIVSTAVVAAIVGAELSGEGAAVMIISAVAAGVVTGGVQGYLIARLRINSIMFTIGTSILLGGLAYVVADNKPVLLTDFAVSDPFLEQHGAFSLSSIIALGAFAVVGVFYGLTRLGRHVYAIGGGRQEAEAAGIRTRRVMAFTFAVSGGCAGLAGVLASVRNGSAAPGAFTELLLPAVAACLIGGISLRGGRGSVVHVLLGVAVLGTISAGLAVNGSPESVNQLAQGALLLVLLGLEFGAPRIGRGRTLLKQPTLPQ